MKWLRTKYIDTHYRDERSGEAHTRGLKQLLGLRSDGQMFETHGFADIETQESLRAHLDTMLDDPTLLIWSPEATDDFKGVAGWVEEL